MPNWKKVIVSGSDASLNSLEVVHASGSFSGSFEGDGSNLTGVATPTGSFSGSFTGSFTGDGSGLTGVTAEVVGFSNETTLSANYATVADTYNALHGPLSLEADVTISVTEGSFLKIEDFNQSAVFTSVSASFAETASYLEGFITSASFAATASHLVGSAISSITSSYGNNFTASNLYVEGTASINYLEAVYETASIIYSSGSTKFGDDTSDNHERTGSVDISGSLLVIGDSNLVASQSVNNNTSSGSLSFWQGSQAEYDLISASADENTVYFVI